MITFPIKIAGLSKTYRGNKGRRVQALSDLSLNINSGEVFGFLGPNGAGKSTTIKILLGLMRPTMGEVSLFGISACDPSARKKVGYLPENPAFYDFLTAREYLHFVGTSFGMSAGPIHTESARVLRLFDLDAACDRPIRGYSKGMVQRLGLAQALLHDPDLYILDEPMSGLDPIGRALVKDIILDLKEQGKTIFFSTHVTSDAERVCDRIGVIVGGVFQEVRVVSELLREGVDGYFCRIRGGGNLVSYSAVLCSDDCREVFVPRDNFDAFATGIIESGGSFDLIEPRRQDVEDYFLSLVRDSEGSSCD